jgi:hypothetical protein
MADSSIITCPKCKKRFKGKGDLRGKKIRCPFCQEPFVVGQGQPSKSPEPAAAKAPTAALAAKVADDDEDKPSDNPYGVTAQDIAPRCPNCANEMESDTAVICLFCGYNTLTRTWGKTEKVIASTFGERFMYLLPGLLCVLLIVVDIALIVSYCLVVPYVSQGAWWSFVDHESLRLWGATFGLFILWPAGYYAFNRLVLNPTPPDKVKD